MTAEDVEIEIELDDDLLEQARQLAAETGRTVEQVVRDAIMKAAEKEDETAEAQGQATAPVPQSSAGGTDQGSRGAGPADTESGQLPGLPPGPEDVGPEPGE